MKFITPEIDFEECTDSKLYDGDILDNRRQFGDNLIRVIEQIEDGAVISIDAPWGEGKSTFINWWQKHLESAGQNYSTTILDAFQHDFNDNAFNAIFGHIAVVLHKESEKSEAIKTFIQEKWQGLASIALKLIPEAGESLSEAFNEIVDKRPETHASQLASFKEKLDVLTTKLYQNGKKKLVFIIDELDRCRPDFAVEMLEKIKHLFSVPGIVWVLAINKDQLADSIRHIYGNKDPHLYFEKFIHIQTTLPKMLDKDSNGGKQVVTGHYVKLFTANISTETLKGNGLKHVREFIGILYNYYDFSLRDIKKHCIYIQMLSKFSLQDPLLYLLPALYIKKPELYKAIRLNQFEPDAFLKEFEWVFQYTEYNRMASHLCGVIYSISLRTNKARAKALSELTGNVVAPNHKWRSETVQYFKFLSADQSRDLLDPTGGYLNTEYYVEIINSFQMSN